MPANLALNPDLESELTNAVPLRFMAEWYGLSEALHEDYKSYIEDLANAMIDAPEGADLWPTEVQILEHFGMAFKVYVELVRRDVIAFLRDGSIPMTPLCEWPDL